MKDITGRDDWIIARALFFAAKALRSQPMPPKSDIEDMEKLLAARYPNAKAQLDLQNDLARAFALGMELPQGTVDHDAVRAWLDANAPAGDNVIALFNVPK